MDDTPDALREGPRIGGTPGAARDSVYPSAMSAVCGRALMPGVLEFQRLAELRQQFAAEYAPVGPTESAIVRDMARHVAALDEWGEAAGAVERNAAMHLPEFIAVSTDPSEARDAVLAAAMSTGSADRCSRHNLAHSRAFYRGLNMLKELQACRKKCEKGQGEALPPGSFASEDECEAFLAERYRRGEYRCPKCGANQGYYVSARRVWECRGCRRQTGLRTGTVMAHSSLPLRQWFEAILLLLRSPTIRPSELAARSGIHRAATVRTITGKIRTAMVAENCGELLAGLDVYFLSPHLSHATASSQYLRPSQLAAETQRKSQVSVFS